VKLSKLTKHVTGSADTTGSHDLHSCFLQSHDIVWSL